MELLWSTEWHAQSPNASYPDDHEVPKRQDPWARSCSCPIESQESYEKRTTLFHHWWGSVYLPGRCGDPSPWRMKTDEQVRSKLSLVNSPVKTMKCLALRIQSASWSTFASSTSGASSTSRLVGSELEIPCAIELTKGIWNRPYIDAETSLMSQAVVDDKPLHVFVIKQRQREMHCEITRRERRETLYLKSKTIFIRRREYVYINRLRFSIVFQQPEQISSK